MIIVKLKGGLGNQFFQYACGRALSLRTGSELKLDTTGYGSTAGSEVVRLYSLSHFNIKETIATPEEIQKLKYPYGIISKFIRIFESKVLRKFYVDFDESIFNRKGNAYLDGFFQTEKYFKDAEASIRTDFTLKEAMSDRGQEIAAKIRQAPISVSLHVRRGDYVSHPVSSKHNGTCSPEYYKKALEVITDKVGKNIEIFVFSDDIPWVRESVQSKYPTTYVSAPEIPDFEEIILMSLCSHHIIANSSFSWWGAWLDPRPNKIIVAPTNWVLDPHAHKDIVPESWIRI